MSNVVKNTKFFQKTLAEIDSVLPAGSQTSAEHVIYSFATQKGLFVCHEHDEMARHIHVLRKGLSDRVQFPQGNMCWQTPQVAHGFIGESVKVPAVLEGVIPAYVMKQIHIPAEPLP
jgi:hypothetical protein